MEPRKENEKNNDEDKLAITIFKLDRERDPKSRYLDGLPV
jgi:hypothetical protein